MLPPPPHRARSYIQTQHGERRKVEAVRGRGRTAEDRVIKAELCPSHQAGQRATICLSMQLLMTWASKNWPPLSHPYAQVSRHASPLMLQRVQKCW